MRAFIDLSINYTPHKIIIIMGSNLLSLEATFPPSGPSGWLSTSAGCA